jgi:hypothetical protein
MFIILFHSVLFAPKLKKSVKYSISKLKLFLKTFATDPFGNLKSFVKHSVADPELVGSGPFWSDPDVQDRIQILALINGHIQTYKLCVKATITVGISVA